MCIIKIFALILSAATNDAPLRLENKEQKSNVNRNLNLLFLHELAIINPRITINSF